MSAVGVSRTGFRSNDTEPGKCIADGLDVGRLARRVIWANFEGGALGSDGGMMLVVRAASALAP